MIRLLILLPIVAAVATLLTPSPKGRRHLLVGTAGLHLLLTAGAWLMPLPTFAADAWLGLDHAGRFFLGISSCLFFAVAITVGPYLEQNRTGRQREADTGSIFVNASPAVFCACLLAFRCNRSGGHACCGVCPYQTDIIDACGECDGRQTGKDYPDVQREIDWSYCEGRAVYDRNGQGHVA